MKMVTLEVIQKQESPIGWPMIHQPIPKGPNSLFPKLWNSLAHDQTQGSATLLTVSKKTTVDVSHSPFK